MPEHVLGPRIKIITGWLLYFRSMNRLNQGFWNKLISTKQKKWFLFFIKSDLYNKRLDILAV